MLKSTLRMFGLCLLLLAASGAAKADSITYSLTVDACTGGCGTAPYGTITLTDDGKGDVNVNAALNPAYYFINTGGGNANSLDFNLDKSATIVGLSPSLFSNGGADLKSPFGSFNNSIACTGCPSGASGVPRTDVQSLSFTVDGVSIKDFVTNSKGYYFASDIADWNGTRVIATGSVGSNGPGTPVPPVVPEPSSLLLLGTGLMACATVLKLKQLH